jgi:hypothetical protein
VQYLDSNTQPEPIPLPVEAAILPPSFTPAPTEIDLLDVLLIIVAAGVAFIVVGSLAAAAFLLTHRSMGLTPKVLEDTLSRNAFFIVPTQLVTYLVIVGFMAFLVWARHQNSLLQAIHWNSPNRRYFVNALMTGAALALVSDIGEIVLHRWIPDSLPITEYFKDRPSALLLGAFGILVAPLMEEMMFRGFIYPALARWTGVSASVVITASAFTLLHGAQLGYSWAPLLLIFIVGVILTVTRVVTKSVATCVIVHMTYNFVLLGQTYLVTHGFRQMQGI